MSWLVTSHMASSKTSGPITPLELLFLLVIGGLVLAYCFGAFEKRSR